MKNIHAVLVLLSATAFFPVCSSPAAETEFRLDLEREYATSAGVYMPDGRKVRDLWSLETLPAGRHDRMWDGLDDSGRNLPPGDYQVRVACSDAVYSHVGFIGNSGLGRPLQKGTDDLIIDRVTGDIYTANNWEEAGQDFRKMDADGRHLMDARFGVRNTYPNGWPIAVALEGDVLYCSVFTAADEAPGHDGRVIGGIIIRKFNSETGELLEFPTPTGYIRVRDPDPAVSKPFERQSAKSIVVCGDALVLADRYLNRIYTFDKNTGEPLGGFDINKPYTIVVDDEQRLWIANDGNKVTVTDLDGKVLAQPRLDVGQIACMRLDDQGQLWVADQDAGQLSVYKVDADDNLTFVTSYGEKARPGEFGPLKIRTFKSFDVMPDGGFVLAQTYGRTGGSVVTRFTADGEVIWQQVGLEFCTNATYDPKKPDQIISTLANAYRVLDHEKGTWQFEGIMYQGALPILQSTGTPRILELNGQRFYYILMADAVKIFRLEDERMIPATIVGLSANGWFESFFGEAPQNEPLGHFLWHDTNGDGQAQPDEIVHADREGFRVAMNSCEVDQYGNLIFPNALSNGIDTLPLSGFDENGNPLYDWKQFRQLIPPDSTLRGLRPIKACPLPDGSMYVLQVANNAYYPRHETMTPSGLVWKTAWMGGWVYSKYDPQMNRLFTIELPEHIVGMDWIPNVQRTKESGLFVGDFFAKKFFHYSPDGLLLGVFEPDINTGRLDHNGAISINRHPENGLIDVLTEESHYNRISWHRIDDRNTKTLTISVNKPAVEGETYAGEEQLDALLRDVPTLGEAPVEGSPEDVKTLEKALAIASEREKPLIHELLGWSLRSSNPAESARHFLLATESPAMETGRRYDLYLLVSGQLRQEQRFEEALDLVNRITTPDKSLYPRGAPRSHVPRAMIAKADVYLAMDKPAEALAELEKALEYGKTDRHDYSNEQREVFMRWGNLLRQQEKFVEAIAQYEKILNIDKIHVNHRVHAETHIADTYRLLKDLTKAAEHYAAAARDYPEANAGLRAKAFIQAGDATFLSGDKDRARGFYQAAIDLPDAPENHRESARKKLEQLGQ